MRALVIGRIPGDPDELLATLRDRVDPVVAPVAIAEGALSHWVARTPSGLLYVDRWGSSAGHAAAMAAPEVRAAFADARIVYEAEVYAIEESMP